MHTPNHAPRKRATWIGGVALVTIAVSGYFMGLRQTSSALKAPEPKSTITSDSLRRSALETNDVPIASGYVKQDWIRQGHNAGWTNHLARLVQTAASNSTNFFASESDRALALQERSLRRAYNGAPPVVPHPIQQDSSAGCLACHESGLAIKDRVAPRISHPHYASCTQCHVPAGGTQLPVQNAALREPLALNRFGGAPEPGRGERAWIFAPPAIPHSTLMRTDCLSCHGATGRFALRTPHPERHSCMQCHVPSANLDQRRFTESPFPRTN
ncbi:MAG TPA: nitrate reductase cytochrome c-type subunit [Verrucomicrobiae bacterium]|nr:nitrate reductase cytochrome c-type subunit [Verrucomicrobiae bacterium]